MSEQPTTNNEEEHLKRSALEQLARAISFIAEGSSAPEAQISPSTKLPSEMASDASGTIESKE